MASKQDTTIKNQIVNIMPQSVLDGMVASNTVPHNEIFYTEDDSEYILYSAVGQNTNGAMTQKAVTDELAKKAGLNVENNFTVMPKVNGTPINQIDDTVEVLRITDINSTYWKSGDIRLYKYGRVCILLFYGAIKTTNDIPSWTHISIGSIPQQFRPIDYVSTYINVQLEDYTSEFYVDANGYVALQTMEATPSQWGSLRAALTYITAT